MRMVREKIYEVLQQHVLYSKLRGIYCDCECQLFSHGLNTLTQVPKISLARMRSSPHYPRIPHRVESTLEYS